MEITLPAAGAVVAMLCSIAGLHFILTRDLRDKYAEMIRERDEMEKKYLAAEQMRETVMHENLDLIKDFIGQDRAFRELKDENERLKRTVP